jgi:hypothetical protein
MRPRALMVVGSNVRRCVAGSNGGGPMPMDFGATP